MVTLDQSSLEALFPAYLRVDTQLSILAVGPSLRRHVPALSLGHQLSRHFVLADTFDGAFLLDSCRTAAPVTLVSLCGMFHLRGLVLPGADCTFILAVRHSPIELQTGPLALQMSDFGPDDPFVQAILLVGLQRAMIEEARETAVELADERRRSNALLDRIAAVSGLMAHDFNNLLSIISLHCQRLLSDARAPEERSRSVGVIQQTAQRGQDMTRALMALSGQRNDSRIALSINALIEESMVFFRTIAGANVVLRFVPQVDMPLIEASRSGIINCLADLIINAREAMIDGGSIEISTTLRQQPCNHYPALPCNLRAGTSPCWEQDYVAIEIADTGAGMTSESLAQAFDPFLTTKPGAKGIGLTSARSFAEEMGGGVCLQSAAGGGTKVCVFLPQAGEGHVAAESGDARQVRVLLVEDEPFALEAPPSM